MSLVTKKMEANKDTLSNNLQLIGSGSRTFQLYKDSSNTVELVQTGISWTAFFFSGLWLLYKGMYLTALQIFVFCILILLIGIPEQMIPLVSSGIGIFLGIRGNFLYSRHLENNGYRPFIMINANSANHAKKQFAAYIDEEE